MVRIVAMMVLTPLLLEAMAEIGWERLLQAKTSGPLSMGPPLVGVFRATGGIIGGWATR